MTRQNIEKELQKARPSLRTVTPLAHAVLQIYAYFNILLGLSFIFALDQAKIENPLLIVNEVLNYKFWGYVFIGIGTLKLYALYSNNWNLARKSLLVGVSIKAAWALALIVRSFTESGTWFITLIWLALAAVQIATFIFFLPPAINSKSPTSGKPQK